MGHDSHTGSRFPLSLSSAKSDLEKLCDELGGPADLGMPVAEHYMEVCCQDHSIGSVLPYLTRFQPDELVARRHWPWAAVAMDQYAFEKSERGKYADEPSPMQIVEIMGQIKKAAADLGSGIDQLQTLSSRLNDPGAPLRRAHLAWLDAFISQAI